MKLNLCGLLAILLLTAGLALAQTVPQPSPATAPTPTHHMTKAEKAKASKKIVDLNAATKEELAALPGIGPAYAQKIIDARPYNAKNELLRRKVIPADEYTKIKDRVVAHHSTIMTTPADAPNHKH